MRPTKPTIRDRMVAVPDTIRRWSAHRGARLALAAAMALLATNLTVTAQQAAQTTQARWGPTQLVWVASAELEAGTVLADGDVRAVDLPTAMIVDDAVATSPVGSVAITSVMTGEVLRSARLHAPGGAVSGRRVIRLTDPEPHLRVGSRLDLYRRLDGGRVATAAHVVEVADDDVPVIALAADDLDAVLDALTTGGVTPVIVD